MKKFDIIVIGGGHAGCEAAYASAKLNKKVALITANLKKVADMPCNPSIGGTAKGIVVREIDALGGLMGKIADRSHFQIKMLNNSKGPAVRSLRAQADKEKYPQEMLLELQKTKNLEIIEEMVENLLIIDDKVKGVIVKNGEQIESKIIILTTGTYLKSHVLVGNQIKKEGPDGEKISETLSGDLEKLGFNLIRLKTGTPQRIAKETIDYSNLKEETGDQIPLTFSFDNKILYDIDNQEKCYVTYTTKETHDLINENLDKSAMFSGNIEGTGARYCPSIEDKIVRFADKERHQLFLEPESKNSNLIYLQGFSTSMPHDIQEKMVKTLPGLENAKIIKYAYAIEYDAINPNQLNPSLETKIVENLFTAGQINGTSGYEEAAGQGLIAGINASRKLDNKEPLILKRNEAYIGVLIDDLITKGTTEPYRLLTSRAEFRLILRHDNADLRLRKIGYETGLVHQKDYERFLKKENNITTLIQKLKETRITSTTIPQNLKDKMNADNIQSGKSLYEFLKRPEINIDDYIEGSLIEKDYTKEEIETTEFLVKYEGYINKTYKEVERLLKLEEKQIPEDINYDNVINLASEAREKLKLIKPRTIAQATRISGVNSPDISMLAIYLKREYGKK